jgi:hypothetical protein
LWLANLAANSQRIQLCWQRRLLPDPLGTVGRITEADLCAKLGLDRLDIYDALTGGPMPISGKFRAAVEKFRAEFESQLPRMVKTHDTAIIAAAFAAAGDEHDIAEVRRQMAPWQDRGSRAHWLKNLHRAVWIHTPADNSRRAS